jgi:hypothetical protein
LVSEVERRKILRSWRAGTPAPLNSPRKKASGLVQKEFCFWDFYASLRMNPTCLLSPI